MFHRLFLLHVSAVWIIYNEQILIYIQSFLSFDCYSATYRFFFFPRFCSMGSFILDRFYCKRVLFVWNVGGETEDRHIIDDVISMTWINVVIESVVFVVSATYGNSLKCWSQYACSIHNERISPLYTNVTFPVGGAWRQLWVLTDLIW